MIKIEKLNESEKHKFPNCEYVLNINQRKTFFTEKALVELSDKIKNVLDNEKN